MYNGKQIRSKICLKMSSKLVSQFILQIIAIVMVYVFLYIANKFITLVSVSTFVVQ